MNKRFLFDSDTPLQPWFWAVMTNRIQIGYFVLILPGVLVYPYMLWVILIAGLLAFVNILLIGKCMALSGLRNFAGSAWMRVLSVPCMAVVLLKMTIIVKGYVAIVHQVLFPSVTTGTFMVLMLLAAFYLARYGMLTVLRFGVTAFISTLWLVMLFGYVLAGADYSHLFPLIPRHFPANGLEAFLFVWSAFAGPEYFIALGPWSGGRRLTKYLAAGHVFSILEYVYLFAISLMFFGPYYLKKLEYPIVHLIRYIQLPFFERVEMIMIPVYMTSQLLFLSLFLLYLYGSIRVMLNRLDKPARVRGLTMVSLAAAGYLLVVDRWFWSTDLQRKIWEQLQVFVGGITFVLAPVLFLAVHAIHNRRQSSENPR